MGSSSGCFVPSRSYARTGWIGISLAVICLGFAVYWPLAFVPATLAGLTSAFLFWLAGRPRISLSESQFSIGPSAIDWREVRAINMTHVMVPLVLRLHLTGNRKRFLIYPGDQDQVQALLYQLRLRSKLASFDGVPYGEYWTWATFCASDHKGSHREDLTRLVSPEEEAEIERLYQRLKSVGHLDSSSPDSQKSHE